MAVTSIRFNSEEEKMISFLSEQFESDKSTLIKKSLTEMYEDFIDKKTIEAFEANEKNKKTKFLSAEEMLKLAK